MHINQFPKLEVPFASNLSPGQQGGRYLPCLAWNPVPMVQLSSLSLFSWEWLNIFPRDERQFAFKLCVHGPSSSSSLGLVCLFHWFKNLSLHQGSLFSIWDQSCTSSQLVLHHCTLLVAFLPCRGGFAFYVLKAIPHIIAKLIAFLLYCWFVCFSCFSRVGIYPHRRCEKWIQLSMWSLSASSPVVQPMQETRLDPWVRTIPWKRRRQPTPVFFPGEPRRQRRLGGYSPQGHAWVRRLSDGAHSTHLVTWCCSQSPSFLWCWSRRPHRGLRVHTRLCLFLGFLSSPTSLPAPALTCYSCNCRVCLISDRLALHPRCLYIRVFLAAFFFFPWWTL